MNTEISEPGLPLSDWRLAGDFLYISGQVPRDGEGAIFVGDFEREVQLAMAQVGDQLAKANASWSDVVRVGAYLSNSLLFEEFNDVYKTNLAPPWPARTTLVVGFCHPDVRVELDAVAYVGNSSDPGGKL